MKKTITNKARYLGLKLTVMLFALLLSPGMSFGQLLQWNTFGNAGTETTEPSTFNDANIAAANLTQGTITAASNANRFGGSNWWNTGNTAAGNTLSEAIAGNDYMQFVVTPNSGYSFTPTSFYFSWQSSSSGPKTVTLRSSADSYAADLGSTTVTASIATYTITISGLTNITTATTFRLYGYGATATTGTGGFDVASSVVDVQLNGTTAATSSSLSTVLGVTSSENNTISSIINTSPIAINTDGTQVWQYDIYDGDGTNNDVDALSTNYTSFTFTQGVSNTVTDWSADIQSLKFFDGATSTPIAGTVTVNATTIVFTPTAALSVADGAASKKTISMRLTLKSTLPASSDNKIFQFNLTKANTTVAGSGSQLANFTTINSDGTKNKIEVTASKLLFVQQPSNTSIDIAMSPNPTAKACDANENTDVDYVTAVSVSSTGSLTASPVSGSWSNGIATFSSLVHTVTGTGLSLTATTAGITDAVSNLFDITQACVTLPTITTTVNANTINTNTASSGGQTLNAGSGCTITAKGVCWGTSTSPDISGSYSSDGTGATDFTSSLSSLSINTQYYVRAYATNGYGTGYGPEVSFWTLANIPNAPTVNAPTTSNLTVDVNNNSNPSSTEFAIYETSTGTFVQADGSLAASEVWATDVTWGAKQITGLTSGTTYTFEVKARNGNNTETSYSTTTSGTTFAIEPTNSALTFTSTANSTSQITVNWADNDGAQTASGFLVLANTSGTFTDPIDGVTQSDATLIKNINHGTQQAVFSGLTVNTQYYFKIFAYNGTNSSINYKTDGSIPTTNTNTLPNVPTITTTNAVSNISESGFSSGGSTLNANGGTISAKGVVYNTTTSPSLPGLGSSNEGTGTSDYTSSITGLNPQTLYYIRAYATNEGGTGYGTNVSFRTFSNPPAIQASNLSGTVTSTTALNITWTAASFPVSGATSKGYVLLRATSPNTPSLGNSNGAAPSAGVNTTIVSSTITEGATSQASTGLTANTTYNYLLVPFCWDGTNATTYNYLTTSAQTVSIATPSNLSDVVAVASSESATISSLMNDAADLTSTTGVQVWQITVRDGGIAMSDGDNLPTIVTGFTLSQNTGNAIDNWQDAIKTIALFDGGTWIANASSITNTTIVFSGLNISVADNSSKTLSLRLSLNTTLNNVGSGNLDGDDFVFSITNPNITIPTDGTSSTKLSSQPTILSTNGLNVVDIVATKLVFVQQPTNITTNTNISPAVTVKAVDAGNNTDKDFVSSISITATGSTLTGSPVTSAAVLGIATFSTLQLSTVGSGVTLTASYSGLTDATSNTFEVTLPLSAYTYRTLRTGNWSGITLGSETWERTTDGNNWTTVTSSGDIPNSSAGAITIKAGHTVTVSSSTDADEFTVEATAQITISASQTLTIANGTGTDATINGNLKNIGTLTNNGQMSFGNGSIYEHNKNGGSIPTNTIWDANSTLLVTGITSTIPAFTSSDTYGNVTWNCSGHSGTLNLVGNLKNIAGNFIIQSTGTGILRLSGGASNTFTIGGNLEIIGSSSLQVANAPNSGSYIYILNLGGNYNQTGGTFSPNTGSYNCAINFIGSSKTFTQSSGTLTNSLINWTINNGALLTLANNLPVASSRTLTVNGTLDCGSTAIVSGTGTISLANGATLKTAHASGLNGSLTVTTKTLNAGANYEFNGTADQSCGALLTSANNVTLANTSGKVSLSSNLALSGTLTVPTGNKIGASSFVISGAGNVVLQSGSTFYTTHASGLNGNLTTTSKTIDAAVNYVFNGTADQTTGALLTSANDITLANTSGKVSLSSDLALIGTITIPSANKFGTSSYIISGVGNIILQNGSDFFTTHPSGINGNFTTTGLSSSYSTAANYTFNGSSAQVTGSLLPTTINNLTIDNAAGVTLSNSALTVNGTLLINSGKKLEIGVDKQLTVSGTLTNSAGSTGLVLKSDATGTASLIHSTAGVSATVERYIPKNNSWHFLSSPVATQAIIPNFAPTICNTTFDFYKWDASVDLTITLAAPWINLRADATTYEPTFGNNFEVGRGYLVAYSGGIGGYGGSETHLFEGTLNSGDKSIGVVYEVNNKFNLIGNPFPSAINWGSVTKTDLASQYAWVYNESKIGGADYEEISTGTIAAMQGFFVEVNPAVTTFTIPNTVRTHDASNYLKSTASIINELSLKLSNGTKWSSTRMQFINNATTAKDWYDALKMFSMNSSVPQIYSTISSGQKFAVNALPSITTSTTVAVGILVPANGNFSITAEGMSNFSMCTAITLEDLKTNTTQNLLQNPVYNFTATTTDNANRFVLHFATSVGVNENGKTNTGIYAYDNNIYVNANEQIKQIAVYNTMGQLIKTTNNVNGLQKISMNGHATGYYIIKVITDKNVYSEKVLVK